MRTRATRVTVTRMRRSHLATLSAVALTLLCPALAQAGTATGSASSITYQADAGTGQAETINLGIDAAPLPAFVQGDRGVTPAGTCQDIGDPNRVNCDLAPVFIVFMLGFDDFVNADQVSGSATVEAHGGGGGDELSGSLNADRLYGDDGDDRIVGAGGNDTLEGGAGSDGFEDGPGDDSVSGGPGDDRFVAGAGRDTYAGGDGNDRVDYSSRGAPVTITLDVVADDGEAGEGDYAGAEVEEALGGAGADRIVAGLNAATLVGGSGNDSINGGPSGDRIEGNEGDDLIDSRDGRYDSVDCGPGTDTILADLTDSAENCEIAPDRDGDGTANEADCAPDDPAVHPGAGEIFGNPVDEDCVGGPNYLRVDAGVKFTYTKRKVPAAIRWKRFRVVALDAGDQIEVRCRGKGCAFKRARRTAGTSSAIDITKLFKKRFLSKGAVVEIRITRENQIGIVRILKVVKGPKVKETRRCLPVGSTTPGPCPTT